MSINRQIDIKEKNNLFSLLNPYISLEAHPLQPQCVHSIIFPSSNLSFGTLHIHVVPKL